MRSFRIWLLSCLFYPRQGDLWQGEWFARGFLGVGRDIFIIEVEEVLGILRHQSAIVRSRLNMMIVGRWNHQHQTSRIFVGELPESSDWDMIVFDVDGTLLDREGFHDDLVSLARKVDSEVMTVSLASGRTLPNVTPIRQSLGVSEGCQGGDASFSCFREDSSERNSDNAGNRNFRLYCRRERGDGLGQRGGA